MLTKIYLAALAVAIVVAALFAYYAWSWLQSVGDPRVAWENYNYDRRAGVYFAACSTAVLILIGNVVLWLRRNAWALWVSAVYFSMSTLTFLIFLHLAGTNFCIANRVCQDPSTLVGPLLAVFGSLALTAFLFADQFVLLKLNERMYGRPTPEADVDPKNESSRLM